MKLFLTLGGSLLSTFIVAQTQKDTLNKQKEIEVVTIVAKKPTVESKADRTVFNVANSSILAGNTTWDIVKMSPLVSVDNNDVIKAEGESVTVYINDRKSVFTGKELKEYLKTIPADNLLKIEVITSPSSRYEATGAVINIVLKKRDDEGLKGSISLTNTQNTKNNQYGSLNLNYHKKSFTQTFTGSYSDNTFITQNSARNTYYKDHLVTVIDTENTYKNRNPSVSSTSEFELDEKNNIGLVLEYYQGDGNAFSNAAGANYLNDVFQNSYVQDQNSSSLTRNLGTNIFYKYYDKEKNKILDINLGSNYNSNDGVTDFIKTFNTSVTPEGSRIDHYNQNRNYYLKVDYTTPLGKNGGNLEVGGKANFNNNVIPNTYYNFSNGDWIFDDTRSNNFHYSDNINSVYANYSKTFFKKLETRIGLRYEYIRFKIRQDVGNIERTDSYGTLLPNLLLKYSFSNNYDLTLTYNHSLWRPWYAEFNPFLMPNNDGLYSRGNMDLLPNPNDRVALKLGLFKKYFISARYMFTDQDYWNTFVEEDGKTISQPANFKGKVEKFYLFANTNQNLLKNKLNINFGIGWYYIDNSDFNTRNNLSSQNYISYFSGSTNLSYTNLFNKNINLGAWFSVDNQNSGNSIANKTNFFHNISVTKIFPASQIETSLQLMNIFKRPNMNTTTYSQIGTFQNSNRWDWYGFSLTFVKRFGNQKVKENTKKDVEKNEGGGK